MHEQIEKIKVVIESSDAIVIGAGSGLSTAAGFTYTGKRFDMYFHDFIEKYGFSDMYSGGFYPFSSLEEHWAYWSRYIYINRYMNPTNSVYLDLLKIVKDKEYFVITTNVDHQFQKAGFEKERLFYTQGDYGLFQCSKPCHTKTYDNEETITSMVLSQGFTISKEGNLEIPDFKTISMRVSDNLIPYCPVCHRPISMNLRADDTFVEDTGWHQAHQKYQRFLKKWQSKQIVFLELGVGYNTPGIIKYPFWQMAYQNPKAFYVCLNLSGTILPKEIENQSLSINGDLEELLKRF